MGGYCVVRWANPSKDLPRYTVVLHDSSVEASVRNGSVNVVRTGMGLQEAQEVANQRNHKSVADVSGRRIAQRFAFETRFRIRVQRDNRSLTWEGWARDLSESGLGAFLGQTLHVGEMVTLEIPLPKSEKLTAQAKVTRCLGTQYGFQFTTLAAEQRIQVQEAVRGKPSLDKACSDS